MVGNNFVRQHLTTIHSSAMPALNSCAVLMPLPEAALAKLRTAFTTLHYLPDFALPASLAPSVDYIFTSWKGLPPELKLADLPNLKHIQMPTAGADNAIKSSPGIRELRDTGSPITLSTASGIHVLSIPPWVVAMTVNLYHQLHTMIKLGSVGEAEERQTDGRSRRRGLERTRSTTTGSCTSRVTCMAGLLGCW